MWCVVKFNSDDTYDCVPSIWLLDEKTCLYPDKSKQTLIKLAKNCCDPESDWPKQDVEIIKKDIDDYDKCLVNCVRLTKGKATLSMSETEDRGRGKRKKYRKESSSSDDEDDIEDNRRPKKKAKKSINFSLPFPEPPSIVEPVRNGGSFVGTTPSRSTSLPFPEPPAIAQAQPVRTTPCRSFQLSQHSPAQSSCRQKNRKHRCVFELSATPYTSEVGHILCAVSSDILLLSTNLKCVREELLSMSSGLVEKNKTSEDPTCDVDVIMDNFPLTSLEELNSFEQKIKTEEVPLKKVVAALYSVSEKSSLSRTITSICKKIVTDELALQYTLKGQARRASEKKTFLKTILYKILLKVTQQIWVDSTIDKVNVILGAWLTQAQARKDRRRERQVDVHCND